MSTKFAVNLHKLAAFVNTAIPVFTLLFFLAGWKISFYFHFLTIAFLFLFLLNSYYLYVQNNHSLLRNFGILAQVRYVLESIGPELRQYLYSSDTEERPFNRNEREEVYQKAAATDSATSFGSQKKFDSTEIKLRHSMFPVSKKDLQPFALTFGEERDIENAYTLTCPYIVSAMSYGSLGEPAVRSIARGAKKAGTLMNTGEGGYPKYHLMEGCHLIFQMGTAKFGVRNPDNSLNEDALRDLAAKDSIKMIEIKFSQGAKPGKGGLLPKEKITPEIAELRGIETGQDVISPPYHVECRDYATTVAFIARVQAVSGLPTGIKLSIGRLSEFERLVKEMRDQNTFPDWITIDGSEGGTGAAPKAFADRVGLPLFPALKGAQDILIRNGVRQRLKLIASGKLVAPGRQIIALCIGADAIATARGFMLAIGCVQAMQCAKNTCPVGITTHSKELQRGLDIDDKAVRVCNYISRSQSELWELVSAAGVTRVRDLSFEHLYAPAESTLHQSSAPN